MVCGWKGREVSEQANRLTYQATDKKTKKLLNWIIRNNKVTLVQYFRFSYSALSTLVFKSVPTNITQG